MTTWNVPRWFPWAQPAVPFYLMPTFTPCFSPLRAQMGSGYFQSVVEFTQGQATWMFRPADAAALGIEMIDFLMVPANRVRFEEGLSKALAALAAAYEQIEEADLSLLGDTELKSLSEDFFQAFHGFYVYGAYVEPIGMAAEGILKPSVKQALAEKQLGDDDASAASFFSGGGYELYTTEMLRSRLTIASELLKSEASLTWNDETHDRSWAEGIVGTLRELGIGGPLASYIENYSWSRNNYERRLELTEEDVILEIASAGGNLVMVVATLTQELETANLNRNASTNTRARVVTGLRPFEISVTTLYDSVAVELSDTRKRTVLRAISNSASIIAEVARRTGATKDLLLYLFPEEVGPFLEAGFARYEPRLSLRREGTLVYQGSFSVLDELSLTAAEPVFAPMDGPALFEGATAAEEGLNLLASRLDLLKDMPPSVIRGTISFARVGNDTITGVARVVRDPFVNEFEPGEILVASSTTPDFVGLMRIAKAIITDWGGQSSHAALTSRELGVPCITETAFASSTIKTGDSITIDFTTGIISKSD